MAANLGYGHAHPPCTMSEPLGEGVPVDAKLDRDDLWDLVFESGNGLQDVFTVLLGGIGLELEKDWIDKEK